MILIICDTLEEFERHFSFNSIHSTKIKTVIFKYRICYIKGKVPKRSIIIRMTPYSNDSRIGWEECQQMSHGAG